MKQLYKFTLGTFVISIFFISCTKSNYTASFHPKPQILYNLNNQKSLSNETNIVESTKDKQPFLYKSATSKIESEKTDSAKETIAKTEGKISKPTKNQSKTTKPNDDYPKLPIDGFALTSFIMGVLFPLFYWAAPLTLLFGLIGLNRIKKRGTRGKGFAITGIVIGSLILLLAITAIIIFLILFSTVMI